MSFGALWQSHDQLTISRQPTHKEKHMSQNNEIAEWCSQWKNGWYFLLYLVSVLFIVVLETAVSILRYGVILLPVMMTAIAWYDIGTVRQVLMQAPQDGVRRTIEFLCYASLAGGFVIWVVKGSIQDLRRLMGHR